MYILINIYTNQAIISESILIWAGSQTLMESSRVYMSLYRLIIEPSFLFTNNPFNNQVEHESSLVKLISSKFASS
jgi:hypothetical protein